MLIAISHSRFKPLTFGDQNPQEILKVPYASFPRLLKVTEGKPQEINQGPSMYGACGVPMPPPLGSLWQALSAVSASNPDIQSPPLRI